jgi:uncharacterized membrane protein
MSEPLSPPEPSAGLLRRALAAWGVAALLCVGLDLLWLGVLMRGFYDSALGPLKRPEAYAPAAALFYALYTLGIGAYAAAAARNTRHAALRGAGLGFAVYAGFELTCWAVLQGWPARLVPVDTAWGVTLTAFVAMATHWLVCRKAPRP